MSDEPAESWYPKRLAVGPGGTAATQRFISSAFAPDTSLVYAELGIYEGATAEAVARQFPRAQLHLFDYSDVIERVRPRFAPYEGRVHFYGSSQRFNDSYNWHLHKLIARRDGFRFDYCFLDGAHTFAIDALAFFLCDLLLKQGGYLDFDDYGWRLRGSSLDPSRVPAIAQQYTDEQIDTPQVKLIVDDLVRPSGRYAEVIKNRIFRKTAPW